MGNRKRRRGDDRDSKKKEGEKGDSGWDGAKKWEPIQLESEAFEKYYRAQGIVPEAEWEDFMKTIRTTLPATFRITGTRSEAFELRDLLKTRYFSKLEGLEIDGVKISVPTPLPWYPNELGWHFESSRSEIRKSEYFSEFHSYLVQETALGNISRQEAVSMIPPIVLDVQPHHKVLDICAAPGSKTSQLIEFLHTGCGDDIPSGLVIANDDSQERCHTLVHQIKRLKSPCTMVVNHDATLFPTLITEKEGVAVPFQFDRILADVPCSGDATLRKNPMVWKRWSVTQGTSLHGLQARILKRGCQLLKVGGRLVYSTCSLNPIENEAVIASLLREFPDAFELVDVSNLLPELKRAPGMTSWKIFNKEQTKEYTSFDEVPPEERSYLSASMFPPTAEEVGKMHLERSMRIVPHHQNTGGFFVAVFQKKGSMGGVDARVAKAQELLQALREGTKTAAEVKAEVGAEPLENEGSSSAAAGKKAKPKNKGWKFKGEEAPFIFLDPADSDVVSIKKYFELPENFPDHLLMIRKEQGKKRTIYYVSEGVREVMNAINKDQLKLIQTGIKIFVRNESEYCNECDFRVAQEGVQIALPFVKARLVPVLEHDFILLMNEDYPRFNSMKHETAAFLEGIKMGSCVFVFDPKAHGSENCLLANKVYIAGWRGLNSATCMTNKKERISFLQRFEDVELSATLKSDKKGKEFDQPKKKQKTEGDSGEAGPSDDDDNNNDDDDDDEGGPE